MFNGRVRINLPQTSSLNEDLTAYTLYPGPPAEPPVILREIGSYFKPISEKRPNEYGIYVDENNTITTIVNQNITLQIEAYSKIDIVNGQVTTKIGENELQYVWKKDGIVLQNTSRITISRNKLDIEDIQVEDSGAYVCEVTNDVGTMVSDLFTIVAQNPPSVTGLYENLVQNGNAAQQLQFWTEVSSKGGEIATRTYVNNTNNTIITGNATKDALVTGYVYPDHFNQADLDSDLSQADEIDEVSSLSEAITRNSTVSSLLGNLNNCTRSPVAKNRQYGHIKVRLSQDVDLNEIQSYVRGIVGGVEGVSINFLCFLGNSISYYLNKKLQLPPSGNNRVPVDLFGFQLQRPLPRFQADNREYVEVRAEDYTRVYIEEYNDASLIKIHGPLTDPYRCKALKNTATTVAGQIYETGELTYENARFEEQIGRTNNLYKYFEENGIDPGKHSLGQLIFLRKLEIPKLNENTNKLRVKVIFEHEGFQQFEFDAPGDKVKRFTTPSILLMPSYTRDIATNKSSNQDFVVNNYKFKKAALPQDPTPSEVFPLYGQPRHFATGFYLSASPIFIRSGQVTLPNLDVVIDTSETPSIESVRDRREFGQTVE